jgi:hypothetical protein
LFYWIAENARSFSFAVRDGGDCLLGGDIISRVAAISAALLRIIPHGLWHLPQLIVVSWCAWTARGGGARRDGVVHFRRIQSPAHTDDHASYLQQVANDCQSRCSSWAGAAPQAVGGAGVISQFYS